MIVIISTVFMMGTPAGKVEQGRQEEAARDFPQDHRTKNPGPRTFANPIEEDENSYHFHFRHAAPITIATINAMMLNATKITAPIALPITITPLATLSMVLTHFMIVRSSALKDFDDKLPCS